MSPGFNSNAEGGFLDEDNEKVENIIDEEELFRLKALKDLKRQYREAFKDLKDFKSQANFV